MGGRDVFRENRLLVTLLGVSGVIISVLALGVVVLLCAHAGAWDSGFVAGQEYEEWFCWAGSRA